MGKVNPPGYKRRRQYTGQWKCSRCENRNPVTSFNCSKCGKTRSRSDRNV